MYSKPTNLAVTENVTRNIMGGLFSKSAAASEATVTGKRASFDKLALEGAKVGSCIGLGGGGVGPSTPQHPADFVCLLKRRVHA